jgi:hypothetical protein
MATRRELQQYLGSLSAILWNYGATLPVPTLDRYDTGGLGFSFMAKMPGPDVPQPAQISMSEVWEPVRRGDFRLRSYAYDFIDHPLNRRRAFHRHDAEHFAREFGVLVHEHCEEQLGAPLCGHYYGLPIDGFQAIGAFTRLWGQPLPLGCDRLACMD